MINFTESFEQPQRLEELHDDFRTVSGRWVFNRFAKVKDEVVENKIRAGFDEISLLDGINFSAKIGINDDPNIPYKYVVFIYGSSGDTDQLIELGRKFPYSEIIYNTASNGVSRESSTVEIINPIE